MLDIPPNVFPYTLVLLKLKKKTTSLFSKFSIINTTSYKNNNILKVKYQQKRVQPRTLLTDYKFNTILYIFYINIIV